MTLSKHRVEALADGVFAIVATLIVLELRVPELPRNATSPQILEALKHLGFPLFSFIVTFALSGTYWVLHQVLMHFIKHTNRGLLFLNVLFLMFVSLLPFSTGTMGKFNLRSPIPLSIYFLNQMLVGTALLMQWLYARSTGLLSAEAATDRRARDLPFRVGALAFGAALAIPISFVAPQFAFWGLVFPAIAARAFTERRARKAG